MQDLLQDADVRQGLTTAVSGLLMWITVGLTVVLGRRGYRGAAQAVAWVRGRTREPDVVARLLVDRLAGEWDWSWKANDSGDMFTATFESRSAAGQTVKHRITLAQPVSLPLVVLVNAVGADSLPIPKADRKAVRRAAVQAFDRLRRRDAVAALAALTDREAPTPAARPDFTPPAWWPRSERPYLVVRATADGVLDVPVSTHLTLGDADGAVTRRQFGPGRYALLSARTAREVGWEVVQVVDCA